MAKQFKNTHMMHLLSESNGKRTVCGIRVTEFTDIVNKEGFKIPANKNSYQFEPYKRDYFQICKKCNQ
jgi:hypothetical protein